MSEFLNLIEQYDPENTEDPKWALVEYLQAKGCEVYAVQDTDTIKIDIGGKTISVSVLDEEEEAEGIKAGTGTYEVDKEVEKLGNTAATGLKGMATLGIGSAQKAKRAVKRRRKISKDAVAAYDKGTERIKKGLEDVKASAQTSTY
jgi:hypothetical protein|tara:strand:+ start:1396 stop:1833 length:438 start_codon:yes stop_codon:yes gene_type:complete